MECTDLCVFKRGPQLWTVVALTAMRGKDCCCSVFVHDCLTSRMIHVHDITWMTPLLGNDDQIT